MATYCINRQKVSHDFLEDEVIAIHFDTGAYYSLRGLAARIWQALEEPASAEGMATHFAGADKTVSLRLQAFLDELAGEGLLIRKEGDAAPSSGTGEWGQYAEPVLEKYTDMQNLLLADPIHDVQTAEGWPYLKPHGE